MTGWCFACLGNHSEKSLGMPNSYGHPCQFSEPIWNGQCSFNNHKGMRCGRQTVFGVGYCWQHLEDNVTYK